MTNSNLAQRMGQIGFSDTIIQIQTGARIKTSLLRKKASVTQLLPALPSFEAITSEAAKAESAIVLLMSYLERWESADLEIGLDALISAHEQSGTTMTLEEAWVIARECRCLGSAEVLNLLFSSYNQDR
ncbi:TPA: hypothetical protein ACWLUJ_005810 [Pseudomonas aeruginosa]|nr:hypothetical protein [Pseudomonas aeruginosa]EIU2864199.1 hypothetical protein [Pseudomonas aeruginosa]MBH4415193.1 hypothetical protein [Pseudomonas aeruginosa]HEK3717347.1 hypothetical protein [Pseudomonas aeruginosa]